ncbi:MAG: hypothetical protein K9N47_06095 [Prosthecobacter sp.]|uniref:hypothetical protein n=1 Tax=Prosthecobacter sp. TaxID=1965333 RepID=UPI0025E8F955|nr:hypothetical protein [Prosthecobacter sp.]MCF7785672.1 hypothetical protein [Prosthecobacter sp.]
MTSREEAIQAAKAHLSINPLPLSTYEWIESEPVETERGWIFEYTFKCVDDLPPEQWESFGGPPGFLVDRNLIVRNLTLAEMPGS